MDRGTASRIQGWDTRPVSSGYQGLRELGDASFSGAVTTGSAWLFMLNGRVLGVAGGTLSSFEAVELTAHEAPDPGLPLLFAMRERGGDTRAKYYTDDNPLPEVHETLTEAGFTGFIELSDNVLSGDYYVVYYGGRSMSVAFVGSAEKLVAGDDAFRQAADEVGIYEVRDVELDVRTVPPPADDAASTAAAPAAGPGEPDDGDPDDEAGESDAPAGEPTPAGDGPAPEADAGPESGAGAADAPPAEDQPETSEPRTADPEPTQPDAEGGPGEPDDPFSEEAAWRETRTIPALDPEEAGAPEAADGGQQPTRVDPTPEPDPPDDEPTPAAEGDRLAELESAIEAQSETIRELESKLEETTAEADQLREERVALERRVESGGDAGGAAGEPLDRETALDQTDLFVRYGTKGGGTLEKAHDGVIDRDEVVTNLRIDHHTRFEDAGVTVDGQPFEAFLDGSLEYRFVDWLVTELLFEILDTGSQRGLRDLFDGIPLIDRAEFHGTVTWRDPEVGETYEETFDVVCRDRMGRPLVVANLNDDRDPATGEMMERLVEGASAVADGHETLGGAFLVTSSFFRPDALETASEATGAGLLSREKRWSYVKRSRRAGYHLCLVEARGEDFHVAVPEL